MFCLQLLLPSGVFKVKPRVGKFSRKGSFRLIVISVLAALLLAVQSITVQAVSGSINTGILIRGQDFSNFTEEEAKEKLRQTDFAISFRYGGKVWPYRFGDLGISVDIEATVRNAVAYNDAAAADPQTNGSAPTALPGTTPVNVPLVLTFDDQKLLQVLTELSGQVSTLPQDADIQFDSQGNSTITPSHSGVTVDLPELLNRVKLNAASSDIIDIPAQEIPPSIGTADMEKLQPVAVLSSFTTIFINDPARTENIRTAAIRLNGMVVAPGEVFSFNGRLGPRNEKNGYRTAKVITGGKFVPGLGGGICQVSSTLYNALLLAGIDVTERWPHSLTVAYIPLGRDATVSYGTKDLKFINNTGSYITLRTEIHGRKLTVSVLGNPTHVVPKVIFRSVVKKTIAPEQPNPTAGLRQPHQAKVKGRVRYLVDTFITVIRQGQQTVRLLSRDHYSSA